MPCSGWILPIFVTISSFRLEETVFAPQCTSVLTSDQSFFWNETGSCYYIWDSSVQYDSAFEKCRSHNSYVVQLETEAEQEWLHSVYTGQIWIGMQSSGSTWRWEASGQLVSDSDPRWVTMTIGDRVCKQSERDWARNPNTNHYSVVCESGALPEVYACRHHNQSDDLTRKQISLEQLSSGYFKASSVVKHTDGLIQCGIRCMEYSDCLGIQFSHGNICTLLYSSTEQHLCDITSQCFVMTDEC